LKASVGEEGCWSAIILKQRAIESMLEMYVLKEPKFHAPKSHGFYTCYIVNHDSK